MEGNVELCQVSNQDLRYFHMDGPRTDENDSSNNPRNVTDGQFNHSEGKDEILVSVRNVKNVKDQKSVGERKSIYRKKLMEIYL